MESTNVIVNYLPTSLTEAALSRMFSPYGAIRSLKIVRDKDSGISMGFGFVDFESKTSVQRAIQALSGLDLGFGKRMKVSPARPAWKANIHSNVFISGIPAEWTPHDIKCVLGPHGVHVENVRILRGATRSNKCAAVVRMFTEFGADAVLKCIGDAHIVDTLQDKSQAIIRSLGIHARPWKPEFRVDRVVSEEAPSDTASFASLQVDETGGLSLAGDTGSIASKTSSMNDVGEIVAVQFFGNQPAALERAADLLIGACEFQPSVTRASAAGKIVEDRFSIVLINATGVLNFARLHVLASRVANETNLVSEVRVVQSCSRTSYADIPQ